MYVLPKGKEHTESEEQTMTDAYTLRNHFTLGNYHPNYGELVAMHDGLHPGPAGAYVMGKKLAQVMIAAGVPARPGRRSPRPAATA